VVPLAVRRPDHHQQSQHDGRPAQCGQPADRDDARVAVAGRRRPRVVAPVAVTVPGRSGGGCPAATPPAPPTRATTAWLSRVASHSVDAPSSAATRGHVTPRHSCTTAAATSASADTASDSDSTDRSHIVTGVVSENPATATIAGHLAHPDTTLATDPASAAQHAAANTTWART
jgi:hypothetical protein